MKSITVQEDYPVRIKRKKNFEEGTIITDESPLSFTLSCEASSKTLPRQPPIRLKNNLSHQ